MPWLASAIETVRLRGCIRAASGIALMICSACVLGGCGSSGGTGMASFAHAGGGPTLAFESIDGPPPQVFDRLVVALNAEAAGKPITIVSRDAAAGYHVRAYLSAQVRRGRTVIAWVFDAYDGNQERALRLTGEEVTGKSGRDAWAAADDQVLRRIAQAGLAGLSAHVAGGQAPDAPVAPPQRGSVVASAEAADPGTRAAATMPRALGLSAH